MIPAAKLYLFDVDGTLLDSATDITAAMREALAPHGIDGLSQEYLNSFIGYHLKDLFTEVLLHYSPQQIHEIILDYRRIYPERHHRCTRVYPGVPEALAALPGLKSTATTKSTETATIVLRKFGLFDLFDHVQGTDGFPSKPEPDVILRSLEKFGVAREDCLLIGDAAPDMEAGRRAGVRICAVRWGYGNHRDMAKFEPDCWINSPAELVTG